MAKPDNDEPDVPNVSLDTVRPPAPSAGDLYSSATVLRQVPQELIEAARARRLGRAAEVPAAPPPPAVPSFDPFPDPSDDAPSLEVGYAEEDDALEGEAEGEGAAEAEDARVQQAQPDPPDEPPPTPRAFAAFSAGPAPTPPAPSSSRPTVPGLDSFRIPPAGPSSRPTPVGIAPAGDLLASARPSSDRAVEASAEASATQSSAPTPRAPPPSFAEESRPPPPREREAAEAETAPLAELDEEHPAFVTARRGTLTAVGVAVMALLLVAAVLLAVRAFD